MELSLKDKYKRVEEVDETYIEELIKKRLEDQYYPSFHVAPKHGLLNDPNGLCYFNGEHHIFYQWFPLGPIHGLKYWYHVSTSNFIDFKDRGIALEPGYSYDSHGCYSGGAWVEDEKAYLFFTGNHRDSNYERVTSQCYAVMDENDNVDKKGIIIENHHFTEHFRDPKVWKENDKYYMVLGAQTKDLKGQMALYSADTLSKWNYRGIIKTNYTDFGFMWECPDYFEISNKGVMLFSPQGVQSKDKYNLKNIYNVTYIIGDLLNKDTVSLDNHGNVTELDSGFDFYAPQTYVDNLGRRILFGWVGLPEITYPTDDNMWAHMLTIPRELTIRDNNLIQKPLSDLKKLRKQSEVLENEMMLKDIAFEIEFETELENLELKLSNNIGDYITFTLTKEEFKLNREFMTKPCAIDYGTTRYVKRTQVKQGIQVFFDHSVMEIFVNNGERTMTSRIFIENLTTLSFSHNVDGLLHYLNDINYK